MIKIKNLILGLKYQLPLKRAFKNFFITRNAWGLFSKNSHINQHTQQPKIPYSTYEKACKAATKMGEKNNCYFSVYKCIFCDGFHIGKNRDNKKYGDDNNE